MTRRAQRYCIAVAAMVALAASTIAAASVADATPRPGALDKTFGSSGFTVHGLGSRPVPAEVESLARQPDGKVVVAGLGANYANLTRLNPDGSVDRSFGSDGLITTRFADVDRVQTVDLELQPDGKIVVAGFLDTRNTCCPPAIDRIFVARYLPDGRADPSFGDDGVTISDAGLFLPLYVPHGDNLAIQPDGRILAAGLGTLIRVMPDGSPDRTFGSSGAVNLDPFFIRGLALAPDGKIIVASDRRMQRLNADGSADTSFGTDGVVTTSSSIVGNPADVAVQPGGRIVLATTYAFPSPFPVPTPTPQLRGYLANGDPDPGFGGGDGVVDFGAGSSNPQGIGLDAAPDGSLTVAGSFGIGHFAGDGTPDPAFGADGVNPSPAFGSSLAVGGGEILFAPPAPSNKAFGGSEVRSVGLDGNPDPSFGAGGAAPIGNFRAFSDTVPTQVIPQPGGGLIVVGSYTDRASYSPGGIEDQPQVALFRLTAAGRVDPAFGEGGVIRLASRSATVLVRRDGTIIAVEFSGAQEAFLPTGRPATSYGNAGTTPAFESSPSGFTYAYGATLNPDGRVVAEIDEACRACSTYPDLLRFARNGLTAMGLGVGAILELPDVLEYGGAITALAISKSALLTAVTPYEKSPVLGRTFLNGKANTKWGYDGVIRLKGADTVRQIVTLPSRATLFSATGIVGKLNPAGKFNRAFGKKGYAHSPGASSGSPPSALFSQSDGRIILVEAMPASTKSAVVHVTRFNSNGKVDPSFGVRSHGLKLKIGGVGIAAMQRDSKLIVAGTVRGPQGTDIVVTRRWTNSLRPTRHHGR